MSSGPWLPNAQSELKINFGTLFILELAVSSGYQMHKLNLESILGPFLCDVCCERLKPRRASDILFD